jgi:hypothetical protein
LALLLHFIYRWLQTIQVTAHADTSPSPILGVASIIGVLGQLRGYSAVNVW